MDNQLGKIIGKIRHSFNITNHAGEKTSVSVTFDFTTSSDADIKSWLASDRTIAVQRPARSLSLDEIKTSYDGTTILANECGKKIKSRAERIAELVNLFTSAGVNDETATKMAEDMLNDPAKMAELYNKTIE
jgi:hypothetical protein